MLAQWVTPASGINALGCVCMEPSLCLLATGYRSLSTPYPNRVFDGQCYFLKLGEVKVLILCKSDTFGQLLTPAFTSNQLTLLIIMVL